MDAGANFEKLFDEYFDEYIGDAQQLYDEMTALDEQLDTKARLWTISCSVK